MPLNIEDPYIVYAGEVNWDTWQSRINNKILEKAIIKYKCKIKIPQKRSKKTSKIIIPNSWKEMQIDKMRLK
jgi:hypothetical protein